MVELSAARADGSLNITENFGVYGSANLNLNTGVRVGSDGVEALCLGWGLTLGVRGKWTFNTSFGSRGGCDPQALTQTRAVLKPVPKCS